MSKKVFALGLTYLWFCGTALGSQAPIQVTGDTLFLELDPMVSVLEDPSGVLQVRDFTENRTDILWQPSSGNLNFGFTDSVYWVKAEFVNSSSRDLELVLEIGHPILDYIEVHIIRKSGTEMLVMGDKYPFDERPIKQTYFVFPMNLIAHESVEILFRFETQGSMQMPLSLYHPERYIEKKQVEMTCLGLYYGAMAILMLYNLFLFSSVRDVEYLYYVVYVFCLCTFLASLNGMTFQYLWPGATWWNDQVLVVALCGALLSGALLAMSFLKLRTKRPRQFSQFMIFPVAAGILILLSMELPYRTALFLAIGVIFSGLLFGLPMTLIYWLKGFEPARFFVWAWLSLVGGSLILLFNKMGFLPRFFLTENATQISSVLQVVLLSISLADRLNMERKEKLEAQNMALVQDRQARLANEAALVNERKEREAREDAYDIQKKTTETLGIQVEERTRELNNTFEDVRKANHRIMSSIRYARMIQQAILPDPEMAREWLPRHFIWWAPRDVVSGDFYYMDRLDGVTIVAVADCTGHGVHGAFMTIISSSELKHIVRWDSCKDPGEILRRLNHRIQTIMNHNRDKDLLDDGLSIGVCVIRPQDMRIDYSGARMDMHLVRGSGIETIRGDRRALGFDASIHGAAFEVRSLSLEPDLNIYMATDGLTNQIGEYSGKRFGTRRLKDLLCEHAHLPLNVQHEILEASLKVFRGNREPVDDITMVGFRPEIITG